MDSSEYESNELYISDIPFNLRSVLEDIDDITSKYEGHIQSLTVEYVEQLTSKLVSTKTNLESINDEVRSRVDTVQEEINTLTSLKESLEEEVLSLKHKLGYVLGEDDLIVLLDVSGTRIKTTRNTLCVVEGSLLATMFTAEVDSLLRNEDGSIFIDFNYEDFSTLVDYLRDLRRNPQAKFPSVKSDTRERFFNMCNYLGVLPKQDTSWNVNLEESLVERSFPVRIGNGLAKEHISEGTTVIRTKYDMATWKISTNDNPNQIFLGVVNDEGDGLGWIIIEDELFKAGNKKTSIGKITSEGTLKFVIVLGEGRLLLMGHGFLDSRYIKGGPEGETHRLCLIGNTKFNVDVGVHIINTKRFVGNSEESW